MVGRILALLALFLCCTLSHAEDAVKIPLDQIWAFGMPGTHPIEASQLTKEIRSALANRPPKGGQAQVGFAVAGVGLQALRNAHKVLVKDEMPQATFPPGKKISLVFFSHQGGVYVHLDKVERSNNTVTINYKLIPHRTREATEHFALIPLTNTPKGRIQVEVIQAPLDKQIATQYGVPRLRPDLGMNLVSGSYSFSVE